MNAITLWQPWASLIALGRKTIETRTHDRFRSLVGQRIAIHAASRQPPALERRAIWYTLRDLGIASGLPGDNKAIWHCIWGMPLGRIVATARVARAGRLNEKDHAVAACCHITDNVFGLFLEDVRRLERPFPCKGARGIWTVPDDLFLGSAAK